MYTRISRRRSERDARAARGPCPCWGSLGAGRLAGPVRRAARARRGRGGASAGRWRPRAHTAPPGPECRDPRRGVQPEAEHRAAAPPVGDRSGHESVGFAHAMFMIMHVS